MKVTITYGIGQKLTKYKHAAISKTKQTEVRQGLARIVHFVFAVENTTFFKTN